MSLTFWNPSGGELIPASRLNNGSAFTAVDAAEQKALDTSLAPNTLKIFNLKYGMYSLNTAITDTDRSEFRLDPTTGVGSWRLMSPHGDAIEEYNSENINRLFARIEDLENTVSIMQAQMLQMPTIILKYVWIHPGSGSIGANSEAQMSVPFDGARPTDIPIIWIPLELESRLTLNDYSFPTNNTFCVNIGNLTNGAVSTASRRWIVGAIRGGSIGY